MNALATNQNEVYKYYLPYVIGLQKSLKLDALGRPTILVNCNTLEELQITGSVETLIDDPPSACLMPIDYIEEIPVIYGTPIWERLEGEPLEVYEYFKKYREQRVTEKSQRSLYKLSILTTVDIKLLTTLRQLYHWTARTQAYDLYQQQERQIALSIRQMEIEGRHASVAQDLFNLSTTYLKEHRELLTPKLAVQILEVSAKLERLASGMSEGHRSSYTDTPQINISNNVGGATTDTIITENTSENKERLAQVLNIMNSIGALQPQAEDIIDEDTE